MGKFVVNGAIDATSHITIKNGSDLFLQAPSSAPNDSGDLIFTKYDGTEQGRIWISGGIGMIRFSSSDSSKTLIHSSNYNSYSPTLTGGGASGTWGINISGSSGYADGSNYTYRLAARGVTANITTAPTVGSIVYDYNVLGDTTGLFPVWHNANAILTLNKHSGGYDSQLGFSSNGRLYYRSFSGAALDTATGWNTIAWTSDLNSYLPLSGGSLSGSLNVGGKVELWSDGEGGNIRLTSPNGSWWSIDALSNSVLRFIWAESKVPFQFTSDGTISANYFTGTANYANTAGYATTADETNNGRGGGSIPWAGSFDFEPDVTSYRSMIATYMDGNNKWWNIISCRHRNGSSDGVSYGMYFKTDLTGSWAHLRWNRQYGSSWQGERYIYDTGNVCISSSNPGTGSFYGQIWFKI